MNINFKITFTVAGILLVITSMVYLTYDPPSCLQLNWENYNNKAFTIRVLTPKDKLSYGDDLMDFKEFNDIITEYNKLLIKEPVLQDRYILTIYRTINTVTCKAIVKVFSDNGWHKVQCKSMDGYTVLVIYSKK